MKLPKKAKRVFKGQIFEVYQWKQRLFNGSFATFERIKRPDSVSVLATQGKKILIGFQKQPFAKPFYGLFAGRVEKGEQPLRSAKRELLEETGLVSRNWQLLKVYEPGHKIVFKSYFFVARNCRKAAKPKPDPGEKIDIKKISFERFIDLAVENKLRDQEIACDILRMALLDSQKLKALQKKLFR